MAAITLNKPKPFTLSRLIAGFSLIELMIVVAVVAILASVAYPSYQNSIINSRRGNAAICLYEMSQFLDRHYTVNLRYNSLDTSVIPDPDPTTLGCSSANDLDSFYTLSVSSLTKSAYQLSAVPVIGSIQSKDDCGTLTLNNLGQKVADIAGCW